MKRMLINATQAEELRVAIVDGQTLYDIDIEQPSKEQKKSNIYKGRITRLEPSLEAAFVEYGGERHGFLPLKEISSDYFVDGVSPGKATIKELLREGQEVVIQVEKEERGNKGAALTTFISLAGRYMVLMPNSPRAGGVSRRIEGDDRAALKEAMDALNIPDDMGVIIRTAGVGRDAEELQWDLDYLLQVWKAITDAALSKPSPFLIYQESRLIIRALRDYLRADIGEILIDAESVYEDAREFVQQVMPQNLRKLKLYKETVPLFNRFQIESQIENAYERTVRLPSGGALVIDQTEALTAIDVNSARATKGGDIEETAFNTNLEAAEEVARQMRLRDLGGLVVIDFIDMESNKHQREVENRLQGALKHDRARVQLGRISKFGLLEMSRQRLRPSLGESSQIVCPRCEGHGRMRSVESLSLSILRLVEEQAMKDNTGQVLVQAPQQIANFLLNEKRRALREIEDRHEVPVIIVADEQLHTPHYNVHRLRENELDEETTKPSYRRTTPRKLEAHALTKANLNIPALPAVTNVRPAQPAPVREERPEPVPAPVAAALAPSHPAPATAAPSEGFIGRLMKFFRGAPAPAPAPPKAAKPAGSQPRPDANRGGRGDGRRHDRDRNERNEHRDGQSQRRDQRERQNERPQNNDKPKQPNPQQPKQNQGGNKPNRQEGSNAQRDGQREQQQANREPRPDRNTQRSERSTQNEARKEAAEARREPKLPATPVANAAAPAATPVAAAAVAVTEAAEAALTANTEATEAGVTATPAAADANGAAEGNGGRRRRGRRGGRRRRRQDGASAETILLPNGEQAELDFEDEDGEGEDGVATPTLAAPMPRPAPMPAPQSATAATNSAPAPAPVASPAVAATVSAPAASHAVATAIAASDPAPAATQVMPAISAAVIAEAAVPTQAPAAKAQSSDTPATATADAAVRAPEPAQAQTPAPSAALDPASTMVMRSPIMATPPASEPTPSPGAASPTVSPQAPAVAAPAPRHAFAPIPAPIPAPSSLAASVHAAVHASNANPAATVVMRSVSAEDLTKASGEVAAEPAPDAPADDNR
ncbi:MAG: Rne/Rng family ribonuclease [Chiayiivirga sp.]|jgi:ribonuclease E|uniref:Rne/Rng family ribonuclease n=1 Tax=Chiayiivirga sp. TaxID=2041042 RepID=UPI0025C6C189|nr:Rne/Rng family ribonuclease [Chiayiivirga sp.]MCI1729847.1 Rne/Rng family ribonuclease [Chiayiivirga sp.]